MRNNHNNQSGFSAVELLITLFIATAFIATGYQLYSAIVKDGGDARFRSRASNLAYQNLRQAASATYACSTTPAVTNPAVPSGTGLDTPVITQTISAPQGCASGGLWTGKVMQVQITVTYGPSTNRQDVTHAVYTTPQ